MVKIGVLGGSKKFIEFMHTIFNIAKLECDIIIEKRMMNSNYYDFIVLNKSCHKIEQSLNCEYLLINMDTYDGSVSKIQGNVITYGIASKNTITLSSIEKDSGSFVYCVQRYINTNFGYTVQPQEIPVEIDFKDQDNLYASMAAITVVLLQCNNDETVETKLNSIKLV